MKFGYKLLNVYSSHGWDCKERNTTYENIDKKTVTKVQNVFDSRTKRTF